MNYHRFILGSVLAFGLFTSCTSNENETESCDVLGVTVDCEEGAIYNKLLTLNEEINNTFEDGAEPLTLEEELKLREAFVDHYQTNQKMIEAVYSSIKDSIGASFPPEELFKMRSNEVEHFKKKMVDREKMNALLETLSISTYEKDTLLSSYGSTEHLLVMQINNTTDKTITSIAVEKNYQIDGKMQRASVPTYYIFTTDQIHPTPETAELLPGSKLTLTFKTSSEKKAIPVIVDISTKSEENNN